MTSVVTSFSNEGYNKYGKEFVRTFLKNWPSEIRLIVAHEGVDESGLKGTTHFNLLETKMCSDFVEKYKDDAVVQGRKPHPDHKWRPNALRGGYNFRYDAYKFARKPFAIEFASQLVNDKLLWMDADMITRKLVTVGFIDRLLPDEIGVTHLARPGYHTECGFVGYNLRHSNVRKFIEDFAEKYSSGDFLQCEEWHDSWVFDRILEKSDIKTHRIPWGDKMIPVETSCLGEYFYHFKGARKDSEQARQQHMEKYK